MEEQLVFHKDFYNRLKDLVDESTYTSILHACSVQRNTSFRVNTLKTTEHAVTEELLNKKISFEHIPWYKDAFMIDAPKSILMDLNMYTSGSIYVQSLSSMIPALILDPQPNEKILDLTAAPGSKTTQIASLMDNTGEIIANDNSHIRIYKLKANLIMQGVTNTKVIFGPGQIVWKQYPEYFDRSLVDVPCTMEGRFNSSVPSTYSHWTPGKVKELADKQKWLLRSAVSATKVGGIIVYSTCTLSPEENEGVIDWILKKENGNIEIIDIQTGFPLVPSVSSWNGKTYDSNVTKTKRVIPKVTMEGFYVAKLMKIKSTVPSVLL